MYNSHSYDLSSFETIDLAEAFIGQYPSRKKRYVFLFIGHKSSITVHITFVFNHKKQLQETDFLEIRQLQTGFREQKSYYYLEEEGMHYFKPLAIKHRLKLLYFDFNYKEFI